MKKILVFDLPARMGGAYQIIKEFYDYALTKDSFEFYFILSGDILCSRDNVHVLTFERYRKSVIDRLFFDVVFYNRIIKKINPDIIISFQNNYINSLGRYEVVYVHQGLYFCDRFFQGKSFRMRLQQGVYGGFVRHSLKKADSIIVQTDWMKKEICRRDIKTDKDVFIIHPKVITDNSYVDADCNRRCFFYPAPISQYKNHSVIVSAIEVLVSKGIDDFIVFLTVKEEDFWRHYPKRNESKYVFLGAIDRDEVMKKYTRTVLLFPSLVESFGLPLLEARTTGAPVIASDTPFSHEILDGYENANYFNAFDANELAYLMESWVLGKRVYISPTDNSNLRQDKTWDDIFKDVI